MTKRYQTDCAMPHAALDGPGVGSGRPSLAPVCALADELALHLAGGVLVDLFAQVDRIHVELDGELVDGLLEGEAALRMAGCPKRRARTGVDEDVVLLGQQVGALVHVGRRAGCACAGADACGAVA